MKPLTTEVLTAYVLGELDDEASAEIDRLIAEDPTLEADVGDLEEALSALALALPPAPAPDPGVRARLMAAAHRDTMLTLTERLARLCDVAVETARGYLDLTLSWQGWEMLRPGIHFIDVDGGPAVAGARPGLVAIAPGLRFPLHVHRGEETTLYLQGSLRYDDGTTASAGDLEHTVDGTEHGFEVTSDVPLIYAVVLGEIDFLEEG